MSSEPASALVLRTVEFSETSLVVTLFTREFGKVGALAKGGRRLKGPFESALDLLSQCRVMLLRKSGDALDLLTEAKLEQRFRPGGHDLSRLYAGYYVAELLHELTDEEDPHPDLYDAACKVLVALGEVRSAVAPVVLRWEMIVLARLGHAPSLVECVGCGQAVRSAGRVAFGQLAGGVLCPQCRPGQNKVVSLSGPALAALRHFADIEGKNWARMEMDRGTWGEIRGVVSQYLSHLVGHKLRMHRYLT